MKVKGFKLGATGRHPYGRVQTDGLPSNEARELARLLVEKANDLDRRKA